MRLFIVVLALLAMTAGAACAADVTAEPRSSGWLEQATAQIEAEAVADIAALPDIPEALDREWRSFDRNGSSSGTLGDVGLVALAALVALVVEAAAVRLLSWRARRRMRARGEPGLFDLTALLVCDIAGLAMFLGVFTVVSRHWLAPAGITAALATFAANVLIRWRVAAVVIGAVLRPAEPIGRLIDMSDREARRLSRFLSAAIFAVILLVGFARYGLMDEDSGAGHVIGLINAVLVCGLYVLIVVRARAATEALIRGRRRTGMLAALRAGVARGWLTLALILIGGLMVFFVAGLSLGLLSYYHAVTSTLGILFVVMVLERLSERVWHDADPAIGASPGADRLLARSLHRIVRAIGLIIAAMALVWTWVDAVEPTETASALAMRSATAAVGTLFVAFVIWELVRLAIDRHLQDMGGGGPSLPGADDDDAAAPASRLQTVLPLLRAAFAVVIGVLAMLIVLSRLGVDTAPLIAGAGVFGLAVSFGSQSLVRDIISGLFYMWDDAFRVGEYIDTGRLKGTVETLGIRSVKLRHQNGPLHTIPYGQLGAVTNLSRDFATIKFNLRFERNTDIDLVRRTAKQIGIAMQDDPEIAAEIMLPLKLQGVAEIVDSAVVLRFKFTARPIKPSWVQREYLKRMVEAFAEKGIHFASGAMVLQHSLPPAAIESVSPPAKSLPSAEAAALTESSGVA